MTRRKNNIHDFLDRCVLNPSTWCWEWQGVKDRDGYGQFGYENKIVLVHRLAYQFYYQCSEEEMKGKIVMHICDNPSCVNPDHLKLGTQKDNVQDCVQKGRRANQKGQDNFNAKLTQYQVDKIRELASFGMSQEQLAKMFNVSRRTIHNIRNYKSWNHTQPLNG